MNSAGKMPQNERPALREPQSRAFFVKNYVKIMQKMTISDNFFRVLSAFCPSLGCKIKKIKLKYVIFSSEFMNEEI